MSDTVIEFARYRWGPADLQGTTDASEYTLTEKPNGDLVVVRQDMGPETEKHFGAHDFEQSIGIAADDRTLFVAMLLAHAIEGEGPLTWGQLQDLCKERDVSFSANEGEIT